MSRRIVSLLVLAAVVLILVGNAFYTVSEAEQVIITQFGKPQGDPITQAGLHLKIPFIQKVNRFEKRWLAWDGDANQMPTRDKKFIWVDTYARWRISDPLLYFQRVRDERGAQTRLDDILDGETRKAIANVDLIEVVRTRDREFQLSAESAVAEPDSVVSTKPIEVGREKITREILARASEKIDTFGIELVDVRFKRINYADEVRRTVYDRMISERQKIRDKLRSEGQGRSAEIRGGKERELKRIRSGAYRTAQEIRGAADSTAAAVYAEAYNRDPEFYAFQRTLETYLDTLRKEDILVLSTDGEFYRYLKEGVGK